MDDLENVNDSERALYLLDISPEDISLNLSCTESNQNSGSDVSWENLKEMEKRVQHYKALHQQTSQVKIRLVLKITKGTNSWVIAIFP